MFYRRHFSTKSVPVKLAVQSFVLFVVITGERGTESPYFCTKRPHQIIITLYHGCTISCKVTVGLVEYPDPIREMDLFGVFWTTI